MSYWNQDNFEGLLAIAKMLDEKEHFGAFSAYCRHREAGLRAPAFEKLTAFINEVVGLPQQTQRNIVDELMTLGFYNPRIYHLLPQPLCAGLIDPVLSAWKEEEPSSPVPLRWLGVRQHNLEFFRATLALDPDDLVGRSQLARFLLEGADYAMHHLSESFFIGDELATVAELEEARRVIDALKDQTLQTKYLEWWSDTWDLIQEWISFQKLAEGSFPAWLEAKGKSRGWPSIYYYRS
jgi:hypothetical protein